jgi:integrase
MSAPARLEAVPDLGAEVPLQSAIDAFLARPDLAPSTRRSYSMTLETIARELGADTRLPLDAGELEAVAKRCWMDAMPSTWNRQLATLRSFQRELARQGLTLSVPALALSRRRERVDRTRSIPPAALERLLARPRLALRERCLWRLLYETAGRAGELLGANVEDLDLPNRRIRVRSKGGDVEWLYFQTASTRLLPRLIAGRPSGPLFLAGLAPAPGRAPAAADICPHTGRARLSYRRAAEIFKAASAAGWTLHQLRHSALTHLAEAGVGLPLLMAKSRHSSLRSLERYARPGPEAVAALTARYDPARRRP